VGFIVVNILGSILSCRDGFFVDLFVFWNENLLHPKTKTVKEELSICMKDRKVY
jgi:hypothetical protein